MLKKVSFLNCIGDTIDEPLNNIPCELLQGVLIKKTKPFKLSNNIDGNVIDFRKYKQIKKPKQKILKIKNTFLKPKELEDDDLEKHLKIINFILDDKYYYIHQKGRYTFSSSVFTLLDDDFHLLDTFSKTKFLTQETYIKKAKHKMAIDLIVDNLYRKFNYHHIHSFKKSTLELNLQENYPVSKNEMRYFGDYFDLNIFILDYVKNRLNVVRETVFKNKLSILLIYNDKKNVYYPLLSNTGNHFIHPEFIDKILKQYRIMEKESVDKVSKKFKKVELSTKSYRQNKLSLYNIGRYTLKDLQDIAEDYDIDTTKLKVNKKGVTQQKPKTKKELYENIKTKHSI